MYPPVNSAILTNIAHTLACVPRFYVQVRCPRSKDCACCSHHRLHFAGLDFQEKTLLPVGPRVSRFSCQQEYFSEKCEKLVASEKKLGRIGDASGCNIELCFVQEGILDHSDSL